MKINQEKFVSKIPVLIVEGERKLSLPANSQTAIATLKARGWFINENIKPVNFPLSTDLTVIVYKYSWEAKVNSPSVNTTLKRSKEVITDLANISRQPIGFTELLALALEGDDNLHSVAALGAIKEGVVPVILGRTILLVDAGLAWSLGWRFPAK